MVDEPKPELTEEEKAQKATVSDHAKALDDAASAMDGIATEMQKPGADVSALAREMNVEAANFRLALSNLKNPVEPAVENTGGSKGPVNAPKEPAKV